ncbi:MAG: fumarylacetoacetate hydrolase family protein [Caldilineaceae bacterium]|nr:fumarylacetoacetate hydrolase family protein [Caldilineaceae bacterium]
MKLVTFEQGNDIRVGALIDGLAGERVVDFTHIDTRIPKDMLALLAGGPAVMALAAAALKTASAEHQYPRPAVKLKAPIPRPGKIICIGLNYRDHAAESNQPVPEFPTVFAKYANVVVGPGEAIVLPKVTEQIDYEAEFAVVIGRTAKDVREEDALDYVAGYVPFNDVSARDFQMRTSQWTMGKTFDTFGPMGPALVTADEIPDPHALDITLTIDGEVLQSSNTRNLIFTVPQLIADLSAVMTLEPGDIISTGTPGGVGAARTPKRWLRAGETVCVEIQGLGVLENPVVAWNDVSRQ